MMPQYKCHCGKLNCPAPFELCPERDPKEVSLEQTPEADGLGPERDEYALEALDLEFWSADRTPQFPYTESALREFIKSVIADLKYPMTSNIRAALIDELSKWITQLRAVESAGRAPKFESIASRTTSRIAIKDESHAR